jgi:hypothetical protein
MPSGGRVRDVAAADGAAVVRSAAGVAASLGHARTRVPRGGCVRDVPTGDGAAVVALGHGGTPFLDVAALLVGPAYRLLGQTPSPVPYLRRDFLGLAANRAARAAAPATSCAATSGLTVWRTARASGLPREDRSMSSPMPMPRLELDRWFMLVGASLTERCSVGAETRPVGADDQAGSPPPWRP